jgi:glycerol-3-phosphate acyltransferase PlsY
VTVPDPVWWLIAAAVGYLLGAINPASIVARVFRVDLRSTGSGNPGATNVTRALGTRWGIVVGALDIFKGFVPAVVFGSLVGQTAGEVAGLAAVLGHITSPFLRGRGGKGVATTLGAILGVQPLLAIPVLIAFGIGVAVWHRVGLGAVLGAVVLAVSGVVGWATGWTDEADMWFALVLSAMVLVRHQRNVRDAWNSVRGHPPVDPAEGADCPQGR